jgi:hypothetical protein
VSSLHSKSAEQTRRGTDTQTIEADNCRTPYIWYKSEILSNKAGEVGVQNLLVGKKTIALTGRGVKVDMMKKVFCFVSNIFCEETN